MRAKAVGFQGVLLHPQYVDLTKAMIGIHCADLLILRLEKKTTMAVSKGIRPLAGYPLQFFEANIIASGLWDIIYAWDNRLPSFSQRMYWIILPSLSYGSLFFARICMLLLQRMYWVILPSLSYGSARFKSELAR